MFIHFFLSLLIYLSIYLFQKEKSYIRIFKKKKIASQAEGWVFESQPRQT